MSNKIQCRTTVFDKLYNSFNLEERVKEMSEVEEMVEKFKLGFDAQKSFAQVYEDGKMNKEIGGEMMQLDSVIIQKSRKEI